MPTALFTPLLAQDAPAGGSALSEIAAATAVGFLAIAVVVVLGVAHRRRRVLAPLAHEVEHRTGLPAWAALPGAITGVSLLVAVVGYYWDVSWHIDRGRDPGAFANPAHWLIIIGLDGIAFAGVLALILGDRETRSSVELRPGWHVPVGGILLALCGLIALAGFPADDLWHRLFGQDVTAWGPTHIQMIGGASLATLAAWALGVEGARCRAPRPADPTDAQRRQARRDAALDRGRDILAGGGFLIGLSTLQIEFDFGVPQFRQLFHPVMIVLAASIALVAVRIRAGRGAALAAVAFFLVVNGTLSWAITEPLGRSTMHFPLYLVEALVVEAVALVIPRRRQVTLGLVAGLGIATVGLAAEWAWTHVFFPLPWGTALLPEAPLLALVAGAAGGVLGGLTGRALAPESLPRQATPRGWAAAAWVGAFVCLALPLPMTVHRDWEAVVTYDEVASPLAERAAVVTVELSPPAAADGADDANWFGVVAWQGSGGGEGGLVMADLEPMGDGVWRTDRPVPLADPWKTMVRLHTGTSLQALPLYLPADEAIPAPAVELASGDAASFLPDKQVLQREARTDNIWLERGAYVLLGAIALWWVAALAWGLRRLDRGATLPPTEGERYAPDASPFVIDR
ncbi:MAG: hypothetical protein JNK12_16310 [Acidimicrobiales bacterium]|nr:hypothetical protein [Acidimicrobiales bacterium]